jgi:hypothetical protein
VGEMLTHPGAVVVCWWTARQTVQLPMSKGSETGAKVPERPPEVEAEG